MDAETAGGGRRWTQPKEGLLKLHKTSELGAEGRGGSLPSGQEESPDRRSSVVTRPLASLTSGQALDQQRLGQWLSVGCSEDAGTQTEGGAAPRMRTLKAKRELSVRHPGLPWVLRFHRELLLPLRLEEEERREPGAVLHACSPKLL